MMWRAFVALTITLLMIPSGVLAQSSISVTRKAANLYKVDARSIWIQTRYCYEYAYSEDIAVTQSRIIFLDSDNECDIDQILSEIPLRPGDYEVSLTYEDSDVFSTLEGVVIVTSACLQLGISEDAILRMNAYGTGTVVFLDNGRRCSVEAVLSP